MPSYQVEISADARNEIRRVPGNMRQRVIRTLRALQDQPRPPASSALDTTRGGLDLAPDVELRRVRLESWRIVYVIEDEVALVTVLAIRKRPPYQYEDLEGLIEDL